MYSSSTVGDIRMAMIDGAADALVAYSPIFLLIGGLVLAFVIIESILSTVLPTRNSDTIDTNRDNL